MMLEIDGSMREGGGSVLRFSLALATVRKEPIRIYNIRANRSNPGLSNQHVSAVRALKELSNGEVYGVEAGSEEVRFYPGEIGGGSFRVDIGTAGSTTLILQAVMIPAAFAEQTVKIDVIGGTDNPFAPPIDYLKNVTFPMLKKMGYLGEINLVRRGHYPKGGGEIEAMIEPVEKFQPVDWVNRGTTELVRGVSHCVKLPDHIAKRQAGSAKERLEEEGYDVDIEVEFYEKSKDPHLGPGTGIVLWSESENGCVLGSNALGEKGKPAEKVGREAAEGLIRELGSGMAVDRYLADQIVPYMGLADGRSEISVSELTSHALTNAELVEEITGADVEVFGSEGDSGRIVVEGCSDF